MEDGVIFYCKRCDCRMQTKVQLEIHMSSNQHKMNHPIAPPRVSNPQGNQQLFNFESSSYGYGVRNWQGDQNNCNRFVPQMSQENIQRQQEEERQKQLVEKAKNELLARFPFYAINLQNNLETQRQQAQYNPENIPMPEIPKPVEAPENYKMSTDVDYSADYFH